MDNYSRIDAHSTEEYTVGIDVHSTGEMIVTNDNAENTVTYNTEDTNRTFHEYDVSKFLQDLERLPWMENSLIGDVSERVEHFNQNFLCLLNKHAPVKKVEMKHRQCPFVDEQLKQHMSERDQLLKIAKGTYLTQDW